MMKLKHFLFTSAFTLFISTILVQAQLRSGFISIDCGFSNASSYIDELTGITYLSDANFTENGVNIDLSPEFKLQTDEKQLWNVRSFPQGKRNCYTLRPPKGKSSRYLIRATFLYGNYDNKNENPTFDLYLGVDLWDTVVIDHPKIVGVREIVHVPSSDYINVCLVNTDKGVPFISVLELRPIINEAYATQNGKALLVTERYDLTSNTNQFMRYKDDIYDRFWSPLNTNVWKPLNTSPNDSNSIKKNIFEVPSSVMSTAYTLNGTNGSMGLILTGLNSLSKYFCYFHFAELEKLEKNQTREFNIIINGLLFGPISPSYLTDFTVFTASGIKPNTLGNLQIVLDKTENSTLPPLLNALEIYELIELPQILTNQKDVDAISNVKSAYKVERNSWQGDPCAPKLYKWDGLDCMYSVNDTHRIISLNLSSSGLNGYISPSIAGLTMLESLDLSNNSLSGTVPEFLTQLSFLRVLNLKGNNIKGPVPSALLERVKSGQLTLSVDFSIVIRNGTSPSPSVSSRPKEASISTSLRKNYKFLSPLLASVGGYYLLYGLF